MVISAPVHDREQIDRLRTLPLTRVARALGYTNTGDRHRWQRHGSVLSINGMKFYDHIQGRGGGGAIDLVMHAERCTFLVALARLDGLARGGGPSGASPNWPRIRDYLVRTRHLDAGLIDRCHAGMLIDGDVRHNAVFFARDAGGTVHGAEVCGTLPSRPFKGMTPGSRKARGGFWIHGDGPADRVMLVESAIDALSARMVPQSRHAAGMLISTAGVAVRVAPWIEIFRPRVILCGFDDDDAGNAAAASLAAADGRVKRLAPVGACDWNDLLGQDGDG